ncbi:hypothetical protein niasHT_020119 [Heterodera trifolii]|uniref:Helicase C-terminal domain-containing protein n=1 Tax=Heterodera trifolii TaxID=157864 RepID=A0ABD2LJP1_9BILA
MSATLQVERFRRYLNIDSNQILYVEGRTFPIEKYYLQAPENDVLVACRKAIVQLHLMQSAGDILVFLPGEKEIRKVCELVDAELDSLRADGNEIYPLKCIPFYAALPDDEQQIVFLEAQEERKCVIATNIAETSLTIDDISYVIDSGLANHKTYDAETGVGV